MKNGRDRPPLASRRSSSAYRMSARAELDRANREFEQRALREQVVLIEEKAEIARGHRQRIVGCGGDATVDRTAPEAHAGLARRKRLEPGEVTGIGRAVVDDAKLPLGIGLIQHRLDRLLEERRRAENGHQDREPRAPWPSCSLSCKVGDALRGDALRGVDPRRVVAVDVLDDAMSLQHPPQPPAAHDLPRPPRNPGELARIAGGIAQMPVQHAPAGAERRSVEACSLVHGAAPSRLRITPPELPEGRRRRHGG